MSSIRQTTGDIGTNLSALFPANCSSTPPCSMDSEEENVSLDADVIINIIYTVIGTVGVAGNALVASVLLYFKSLRKNLTNTFIINQSILDGTVSLCIILSAYVRDEEMITSRFGQELFCRLWLTNLPIWGLFVSSTYNMIAVTFERYSALVHPLSHHKYFTRRKAYFIIGFVWLVGPAYNATYMIPTSGMVQGKCSVFTNWPNHTTQQVIGILTVTIQYFIPLGLVIYAYTKIALVLSKAGQSHAETHHESEHNQIRANRISTARKNVIKTLAWVSVCFVFCWSLNQILYTMYNCGYDLSFNSTFYHFTVIMVFCNCCLNPIVYAVKYEQFQKALGAVICKRKSNLSNTESSPKNDTNMENSTASSRVSRSRDLEGQARTGDREHTNTGNIRGSDPLKVIYASDGAKTDSDPTNGTFNPENLSSDSTNLNSDQIILTRDTEEANHDQTVPVRATSFSLGARATCNFADYKFEDRENLKISDVSIITRL